MAPPTEADAGDAVAVTAPTETASTPATSTRRSRRENAVVRTEPSQSMYRPDPRAELTHVSSGTAQVDHTAVKRPTMQSDRTRGYGRGGPIATRSIRRSDGQTSGRARSRARLR